MCPIVKIATAAAFRLLQQLFEMQAQLGPLGTTQGTLAQTPATLLHCSLSIPVDPMRYLPPSMVLISRSST